MKTPSPTIEEQIEEIIVHGDSRNGTYVVEAPKLAKQLSALFSQHTQEVVENMTSNSKINNVLKKLEKEHPYINWNLLRKELGL